MIKGNSIRKKFLFMFFATIMVITIVPIVITYTMSIRNTMDIIDKGIKKNVGDYSDTLGRWFEERLNEIEIYSKSPIVKSMDWNKIENYLKKEIEDKKGTYIFFSVSNRGGDYNTTLERNAGNIGDRDYFQEILNGENYISDPIISRSTSKRVLAIATPIIDDNNKVIGMMGGAIDLENLYSELKDFRVDDKNSYSFIIASDGKIISHPDEDMIMKNIFNSEDMLKYGGKEISDIGFGEDTNSFMYTFKGVKSLYYYNEIPSTNGWRIITKVPKEYIYGPINEITRHLIVSGTIGVILALVFGLLFIRKITNPIIKLKDTFSRAARGDLTARCNISTGDEIEEASHSFNDMMDKITHLTYHDHLTNLPNRTTFTGQLNIALNHCKKNHETLAVLVLGLDKFSKINDTFGHGIGDELLSRIANGLSEDLGDEVLLCRIGGDEFGILIQEMTSNKQVIEVVQRAMEIIRYPWIVGEHEIYVSCSIGISFYLKDGDSAQTLLKNANAAMHRAKGLTGNSYQFYTSSMEKELLEEISLDVNMRHGITKDEFIVHYQPIVDGSGNKIVGMEALVRWDHPTLGRISPGKFIPLAEENGLIVPLGEWILRRACRDVKTLQYRSGLPLYVSVNISSLQFSHPKFLKVIDQVLRDTDIDPRHLKLEITERVALDNTDYTIKILKELKKLGISILIDDFGTGHSSLQYLKEFSVDTLKIDQSFVRNVSKNKKNRAIVSSVISIAKNLGLDVIAEGVETIDELEILKGFHCNCMQGYLFGRPMALEEFENVIIKYRGVNTAI